MGWFTRILSRRSAPGKKRRFRSSRGGTVAARYSDNGAVREWSRRHDFEPELRVKKRGSWLRDAVVGKQRDQVDHWLDEQYAADVRKRTRTVGVKAPPKRKRRMRLAEVFFPALEAHRKQWAADFREQAARDAYELSEEGESE